MAPRSRVPARVHESEEKSQPPGARPDGPHYSATASRGARSPARCLLRPVTTVLQSNLMAPCPRLIVPKLPLHRDNYRANPAPQPLFGYYHTFGRANSSFRRIRSSAPREKIRPVPLRLHKEERDEEVLLICLKDVFSKTTRNMNRRRFEAYQGN